MSRFEPVVTRAASEHADTHDTVRSALLLTVVAVLLTLSIVNGARLLPAPPIADPIRNAPIAW